MNKMSIPLLLVAALLMTVSLPAQSRTVQDLVDEAYGYLESHLVKGTRCWDNTEKKRSDCMPYHFYRPSLTKYAAAQWLWDSGSHMISWSHRDVNNSIADLRTMLQMQDRATGFIPETIFWPPQSDHQNQLNKLFYGETSVTKNSQMPVLAFSLRAIWNATHDVALLQEFLQPMIDYLNWWKSRSLSDSGLVSILHGWESGLDASPMYDEAYFVSGISPTPSYFELYPHFQTLMASYNLELHWNMTEILRPSRKPLNNNSYFNGWFFVEDVGLNACLARNWGVLGELAAAIGDHTTARSCAAQERLYTERIVKHAWDPVSQKFASRYRAIDGTWRFAKAETVQSLLPIMLNLPPPYLEKVLHGQLLNTSKFWSPFPVPSTSMDSPSFQPVFTVDLMWRGPTWAFPTWMVMDGLQRHQAYTALNAIMDRWSAMVNRSGIYEMYNPLNGTAYGQKGLGMSCLFVDWLYRLGRV